LSTPADAQVELVQKLAVSCREVGTAAELEAHFRVREEVFVKEQHFFTHSDHDAHDAQRTTIHVLAYCGGEVAGAVRIYPLEEPLLWKGDRLAVLPDFRKRGVGAPLVRFAVATAGGRGGRRMVANIQMQNVAFFQRLGWYRLGEPYDYVGRPHQEMAIEFGATSLRWL
jgi:putative N-acetyltransferase (TIGR04045 family)